MTTPIEDVKPTICDRCGLQCHVCDDTQYRIAQEQTTLTAIERVCAARGYDPESGEFVADWIAARLDEPRQENAALVTHAGLVQVECDRLHDTMERVTALPVRWREPSPVKGLEPEKEYVRGFYLARRACAEALERALRGES